MKRTRVAIAAMAAIGALTLGACQADAGDPDDAGGDTGAETTDGADAGDGGGDTIRIGIKFDQPGLGFQDGAEYTGFDVDVATYVAGELGYSPDQIEWVEAVSANRETMLEGGQVDMIFATYSITDSRDEVVDFAGPYFVAGQDLLVRADETEITGPEDLNGKNLCSVSGSTSAQRIKDDFADQVQLIEQPGYSECIQYLIGGQVDAVTTDDIILAGLAAAEGSGSMTVVGNPFSEENYGVGLPPGSDQCEAINEAIQAMFDDGSWEQFITDNTEGTGYTPNADLNPPTLRECAS
ncbi:glutamate ABC transporter substrate-binding protein [Occultella glacieicola]|uniref:Glutamate ABC transporter substrate-binding protein n=1 Tax=Occultella glacieicola TaxID=2518684 RepID=A0ABY2E1C2_9MICO|nr:glutamate ABC transporter substrate-binding protein [Occultella glacieicola]TDE90790.1 glutamate ABC transporter substrate-binding protein [Occultella glacieicola]